MRRWVAIIMLIVLPLQLSWAVASNYCLDEQGPAAQHFGHHVHAHHDGVIKQAAKGKQTVDQDCGCGGHLCGPHLLPTGMGGIPSAQAHQRHPPVLVRDTYRSSDPTRIERPKWPRSL